VPDAFGQWPPGCRVVEPALNRGLAQSFAPPLVLGEHPECLRQVAPVGTFDRSLVVFPGARLLAQNGLIALRDGTILAQPAWGQDNVDQWLTVRPRHCRVTTRPGRWFSCLLEFAYNYYHWMCDVLPRLHNVLHRLPPDVRFVVPDRMAAWQWDSLAACGVARERCSRLPPDEHWIVEELYYAPPAAVCGDHHPDAIRWVRHHAAAAHQHATAAAPARLFVTRRRGRRRIVNEPAHWPVFEAAGFVMVEPEQLSFADQVRLFSGARCVVGPHGAGFANITWCAPGARVLEIFSPAYATQRCIWTLACTLGHCYAAAMADDAAAPPSRDIRLSRTLAEQVLAWATGSDRTVAG
jgi:hypothetical protein